MDDSNSTMLQYGFTSLDEEIAKDQMDAESVFRSESSNLESAANGTDNMLRNVNPSVILDVGNQSDKMGTSQSSAGIGDPASDKKISHSNISRNRKRKPTKGLKDENAPKLPQTGYVMYMNERRDVIKNENPNITFPDLTKKIASEWSSMDPVTKKKYLDQAESNKAKYMEELVAYKQSEAYKSFEKKRKQVELESSKTAAIASAQLSAAAANNKEGLPKLPGLDVPIFTEEFLEHNKAREKELRELRKLNTQYEEQNAILSKHVDQLKALITDLDEESTIQRNNNIALVQHLESLRETLASSFISIPLPDTNEVPSVATIDNYMAKLHQLILEAPQEHEELIVAVREVVNKLNLEAYVT